MKDIDKSGWDEDYIPSSGEIRSYLMTNSLQTQDTPTWIQKLTKMIFAKDKILHFGICFVLTLVYSLLFNPTIAYVSVLTLSFAKEFNDEYLTESSYWSNGDLLADLLGVGLALYVTKLFL